MSSDIKPIVMPKWGLAMKEGSVVSWSINVGDEIKKGENFVEIETEKVVNEFESPQSGILIKKCVEEDIKIPVGALIALVGEKDTSSDKIDEFISNFESNFEKQAASISENEDLTKKIAINGTTINYVQMGNGENPTLVFIHGFGGDLNNWMFNQEELSKSFNTFAIDLPGHGASSKNIQQGDITYLSDTVIKFCEINKLKKINFIGHSLGGGICLSLALKNLDLVSSLTLISPIGFGEEIDHTYIEGFIKADSRKELKSQLEKLYFNSEILTRDLINEVLKFKRLDETTSALQKIKEESLLSGNQQKYLLKDKIIDLTCPITIIWGNDDKIIPVKHCNNLPKNLNIKIINEAGHMAHIEKPNAINEIIKKMN